MNQEELFQAISAELTMMLEQSAIDETGSGDAAHEPAVADTVEKIAEHIAPIAVRSDVPVLTGGLSLKRDVFVTAFFTTTSQRIDYTKFHHLDDLMIHAEPA